MICPECGGRLGVETIQEVTNAITRIRKRKLYRCINPACKLLPFYYEKNVVVVHASDLKLE